jgi:hypothetical protein
VDTNCDTHGGQKKCIEVFGGDLNESHHLDDLDGRITLNRILNISMVGCELAKFRQAIMDHSFPLDVAGANLSSCGIVTFSRTMVLCGISELYKSEPASALFLLYLISIKGF